MAHDLTDRIRLVTASLIGLALGALVIAAAVAVSHHSSATTLDETGGSSFVWSSWRPDSTGNTGAEEIAAYVAPFYRLSAAQQLAVITPVAVNSFDAETGAFTGSGISVVEDIAHTPDTLRGQSVAYDLCGQGGTNCEVGGTPSTLRELLLRREALELALYSFEYLPGIQNVVVVLPPGHTAKSTRPVTTAVVLDRAELADELDEPLDATLGVIPPSISELKRWSLTDEAESVDILTARNLFSESLESEQDGTTLVELQPLPAQ